MSYFAVFTLLGRTKLAAAAANSETLEITEMALGDGNGEAVPTPTGHEVALVNEVYRAELNSLTVAASTFTAELVVPQEEGGWTVRELALFDADGDMVAYANTPSIDKTTADDVPIDFRPTVTVTIEAPDSVQVIVNPAIVSASQQWVDAGFLAKGRNLSDLANPATARTNLGAGAANGLATLNALGKIPDSQLPSLALTDTFTAANEAAMLALVADRGDMCVRTDEGKTYVLSTNDPTVLGNWIELLFAASVVSVAGKTGAVTLDKTDVGLNNIDNTSDENKPVSMAQATAIAAAITSANEHADTAAGEALTEAQEADEVKLNEAKAYVDSSFIGQISSGPYSNPPEGWFVLEGDLYSRTTYAALWTYISNHYEVVADSQRNNFPGAFTSGNGTTTFRVPDMRGLFTRGVGGNSSSLGQKQGDAIRNIKGKLGTVGVGGTINGVFQDIGTAGVIANSGEIDRQAEFDASRVVPTAAENRPINVAWRYIIRAL